MIVQSMYFEGNSVTWEHQDSYYLDDEITGTMIAGWIALEDIECDAGRFFICPKSHLFDYAKMDLKIGRRHFLCRWHQFSDKWKYIFY